MKTFKKLPFEKKILLRIYGLWLLFFSMLVYMVVVGELELGDSRMMTPLAETVSRVIFFGGMIYVLHKIHYYKKLLQNPWKMKEKLIHEKDEWNRYLHDKSGGFAWDCLFFIQLFLTLTASLMDMKAFYFSIITLFAMIILKSALYLYYFNDCTTDYNTNSSDYEV